jgi:hypothetical protein
VSGIPAEAVASARRAFPAAAPHALRAALEAAAPAIAAAERERIRQLALDHDVRCGHGEFADLLGGET